MATSPHHVSDPTAPQRYAVLAISVGRIFAGGISWLRPRHSFRLFGLGPLNPGDGSSITSRLFGVRDVALGMAVHHPDPTVKRLALQAGIVIDAADVAGNLISVRAGAPKTSLLGVAAGAALFVGLGLFGLKQQP